MGLIAPHFIDSINNLPNGLTWGKAFKDLDTFKTYAKSYLITIDDNNIESGELYKIISNRYWNRTFKVQNAHQIMTRIQMVWNDALYKYKALKVLKAKDIESLLLSVSELSKAYNNTGDIDNGTGESTEYLQGTGRVTSQSNDYIGLMQKMESQIPNEMLLVIKLFAPMFDAFQSSNKDSATENWNKQ